jgi:hypothetical protein
LSGKVRVEPSTVARTLARVPRALRYCNYVTCSGPPAPVADTGGALRPQGAQRRQGAQRPQGAQTSCARRAVIRVTVARALLSGVAKAPRKSLADWIVRVLTGPEGSGAAAPQATDAQTPRAPRDDATRVGGRRRPPKRLKAEQPRHEC